MLKFQKFVERGITQTINTVMSINSVSKVGNITLTKLIQVQIAKPKKQLEGLKGLLKGPRKNMDFRRSEV